MKAIVAFSLGLVTAAGGIWVWQAVGVPSRSGSMVEPRNDSRPGNAQTSKAAVESGGRPSNSGTNRIASVLERFERASATERIALLGEIRALPVHAGEKRRLANALFARWAELDPTGATAAFANLSAVEKAANVGALAEAWTGRDAAAAFAWAERLVPVSLKTTAIGKALARLVEQDAAAAQSRLKSLDQMTARAVAAEVYPAWVDIDPAAAISSLVTAMDAGRVTPATLRDAAARWAGNDPNAAITWVTSYDKPGDANSQQLLLALVSAAGGIDPNGVTKALIESGKGGALADLLPAVSATSWLQSDPGAARDWFKGLSPNAAQKIFDAAARMRDPAVALAWLPLAETLPDTPGRNTAFQSLVKQWANANPTEAFQYVVDLKDGSLKAGILPTVAQIVSKTDPQLAFETALSLPAAPQRHDVLSNIAETWAKVEPARALERISGLPDTPERTGMLISAVGMWSVNDPAAASSWAQNIPPSVSRDNLLYALTQALGGRQPDLARANATAIHTPAIRDAALKKIAGR